MKKPADHLIAPSTEADEFFAAHPDVDSIEMIFTDFGGVPRGKRLRQHEVKAVYQNGRMMPGSIVVVDITGQDTIETGLVWEDGDADRLMWPIAGSLKPTPWGGPNAAQFQVSFFELDGTAHALDPRHALRRIAERFETDGLTPVVAVELEFYLLDGKRGRDGSIRPARPAYSHQAPQHVEVYGLREMDDFRPFFDDLYAGADAQNLPLESAISEFAPGQYELTLRHKANVLEAVDDAICYKRLVKATAQKHGMEASFMAKPFADQAGSGMHIHVSVNDQQGNNIFASEDPEGTAALRHAIAGMMHSISDGFALFAPNGNSYRRFRANSYAPVAPTWGVNNRTVSFRIPAGPPASRHVEHRVCGADANPYLAVAAVLAGMHDGMKRQLDPGPAVVGNGYDRSNAGDRKVPRNWQEAVDSFESSSLMYEYFGDIFVKNYSIVKRVEQDRYFAAIPQIDYDWYLRNA